MSEYQDTIDALKRLAYADEGDTITCADLWKCDMAVAVIEDLEAENERLREENAQLCGYDSYEDQEKSLKRGSDTPNVSHETPSVSEGG